MPSSSVSVTAAAAAACSVRVSSPPTELKLRLLREAPSNVQSEHLGGRGTGRFYSTVFK